MEKYTTTEI